jgi:hypothetical protein
MEKIYEILSLMDRLGGNTHPITSFDLSVNVRPLIIKEGLIMTYPTESVVAAIAEHNGLSINGKNINTLSALKGKEPSGDIRVSSENGEDEIIVVTLLKGSDKFDGINAHMLKYGWFNYRTDEYDDRLEHMYEKKFGDRFTVGQLLNLTDKIYHITSSVLRKKISSQGLVPKESKTPGFSNEPRVYFRLDVPTKGMAGDLMNMKFSNEPPVVIEVDLRKMNPSQAFFFDPRWINSIFTFEPIPVNAIRVMNDSELPKFRLNY